MSKRLSIIVCSRTPSLPSVLEYNIKDTIGVDYELVVIDNSNNDYTIFTAYNEGVKRSNGKILCFMHDDILYHTQDWGNKILNHFADETIGLIGVTGTHFLPSVPTYWFTSPFVSEYNHTNDKGNIIVNDKSAFFKQESNIVDAVAVDGLCFFVRRKLFDTIHFDDITYSGFHLYDMDTCMQVLQNNYKVCIIRDVLIEHGWSEDSLSCGMEEFYVNLQKFHSKWQHMLPIHRGIDNMPSYVLDRVNALYIKSYQAQKIRESKAYRLGKFILLPFRKIFKKKNK